jgi:Radical SAM superfamily/4Fe-4S single cluster domain
VVLSYLETHIVDHCNLNCRGCGHFSPISDPQFADLRTFENDFRRLAELFDNIEDIHLLGGEPLLHPDLARLAACVRRSFPQSKIWIVTNGVLLSKQPASFWLNCQADRIGIRVSRYPLTLNLEAAQETAVRHGIEMLVSDPITSFFVEYVNVAGNSDPDRAFQTCRQMFFCPILRDGRLYLCAMPSTIHIFNSRYDADVPVVDEDSINIHGDVNGSDILDFLSHPSPICRWCVPDSPEVKWSVGLKSKDDWVAQLVKITPTVAVP